ncbi:MarR family transcriptional regulator [Candidatus Peregrinibacteria bacterium]|nr:MarR family transcriptional regulator [Candidatus Peregrinibacteria bacterium]
MVSITPAVKLFLDLAKVQAVMTRRFDRSLGGLGLSEFIILYHLSQVRDEKMARIDLAEKIGLTASGITRLLAPMEKVGLIKREANAHDARVSLVMLARGGKMKLEEAIERAELLAEEVLPAKKPKQLQLISKFCFELANRIQ